MTQHEHYTGGAAEVEQGVNEIHLQDTVTGEQFFFTGRLLSEFDGKELFRAEGGEYYLRERLDSGEGVEEYANGPEDIVGSLFTSCDKQGILFEYFAEDEQTYGEYVKDQNREYVSCFMLLVLAGAPFTKLLTEEWEELESSINYVLHTGR